MDLEGITGFTVEAVNGSLGRVTEVREGDSGEAFVVVRAPSGREHLLPAHVIEDVDPVAGRIRVYRSTREVEAAPYEEAELERHYAAWGAGHRVAPAERSRQLIVHIAKRHEWEAAMERGQYKPASLPSGGFIHASTAYATLLPANLFYRGRRGLVLLAIDQRRLTAEIRWEEPEPTVEAFPHIHGPVNIDAVVTVETFEPSDDGAFTLPGAIRDLADMYAAQPPDEPD